jgi:L-lactate utilization protein LutC
VNSEIEKNIKAARDACEIDVPLHSLKFLCGVLQEFCGEMDKTQRLKKEKDDPDAFQRACESLERKYSPGTPKSKPLSLEDLKRQTAEAACWPETKLCELKTQEDFWVIGDFEIRRRK